MKRNIRNNFSYCAFPTSDINTLLLSISCAESDWEEVISFFATHLKIASPVAFMGNHDGIKKYQLFSDKNEVMRLHEVIEEIKAQAN